jgi:hypothetical protein
VRRMVLVSTMKAATLHARLVLAAMSLAALLALALTLASPAGAQDSQTDGIPVGTAATGLDTGGTDDPPDLVRIAASDCTVARGASATLEDGDGTRAEFVDDEKGATVTAPGGRPQIRATNGDFIGDSATFPSTDASFDTDGDYTVASSEGVTCARTGDRQRAADDDAARTADDDLRNLDCDELLVLFRGEGQGQYGDDGTAVDLNDSEVRAQIEICLEREIVNNPGGNLPNTGGLSLIGLAVLGAVSAVAGLAVIRGGRR